MLFLGLIALVSVTALSRWMLGSWAAPAALLSLIWVGHTILSMIGGGLHNPPSLAISWIALSCLAFTVGSMIGTVIGAPRSPSPSRAPVPELPLPAAELVILVTTLSGLGYLILHIMLVGPHWTFDTSEDNEPLAIKFLNAAQFAGGALGGIYFASRSGLVSKLVSFLTLVPAFLIMIISTRRSGMLLVSLHWICGFLAVQVYRMRGRPKLFNLRRVILLAVGAVGCIFIIFTCSVFRHNQTGYENLGEMVELYSELFSPKKILARWDEDRHLLFGYLETFSYWLEQNWSQFPSPKMGIWTISGPMSLLGLGDRPYEPSYEVEPGVWSNVYTAFHGLVADFTPLGSMVFLLMLGIISGIAYHRVSRGDLLGLVPLVVFNVAAFYSFIASPMRYNSVWVGWVYLAAYVVVMSRAAARTNQTEVPVAASIAPGRLKISNGRPATP